MFCNYQLYIKYNLKLYVYSELLPRSPLQVFNLIVKARQPAFKTHLVLKTAMERQDFLWHIPGAGLIKDNSIMETTLDKSKAQLKEGSFLPLQ